MGRTAADIGTDEIREVIQRRLDLVILEWEQREFQRLVDAAAVNDAEESKRLELAQRRYKRAVNLVITGALCPRVNGTYTPLSQESGSWPVYTKLGDRDMFLLYVYPDWLIQSTADRFRDLESRGDEQSVDAKRVLRAYVRLPCNPPTYPELRAEGQQSIVESSEFMGGLFQSTQQSNLTITTEQELQGLRASDMMKLAVQTEDKPKVVEQTVQLTGASSPTRLLSEVPLDLPSPPPQDASEGTCAPSES